MRGAGRATLSDSQLEPIPGGRVGLVPPALPPGIFQGRILPDSSVWSFATQLSSENLRWAAPIFAPLPVPERSRLPSAAYRTADAGPKKAEQEFCLRGRGSTSKLTPVGRAKWRRDMVCPASNRNRKILLSARIQKHSLALCSSTHSEIQGIDRFRVGYEDGEFL
jgi:hypothetical protein